MGVSEEGSDYGGSIAGITSERGDGRGQGIRRTPGVCVRGGLPALGPLH